MLVPPLRVPLPVDLKESLINWLVEAQQQQQQQQQQQTLQQQQRKRRPIPVFTAIDCHDDLATMNHLRSLLSDRIISSYSYEEASQLVKVMHEYYAMLKECEERGFPSEQTHEPSASSTIRLEWSVAFVDDDTTGTSRNVDVHTGLLLERASILWNLAALEAHVASKQEQLANAKGWMQANKHLQNAFSFIHHLKDIIGEDQGHYSSDFQSHVIDFWENALQAHAQMAGYEKAKATTRPKHALLSKLAQASVPLWEAASKASAAVSTPEAAHWNVRSKVLSSYMSSRAEWHESMTHFEKNQPGHELVRLEKSLSFGSICCDIIKLGQTHDYSDNGNLEDRIKQELPAFLNELHKRYTEALERSGNDPVPHDLRDIRGELLSKGAVPLPKTMLEPPFPMFTNILSPAARSAVGMFQSEMEKFVLSISAMVNEKTEIARQVLASANLPHSLTAYKQEQSGGGIPVELWSRVETVQRERTMELVTKERWRLRDLAEQARIVFVKIETQLIEDVEMDKLFREQNPSFDGHSVQEFQTTFRQSLAKYEKLLGKARAGDAVLLSRLEVLDQDSKFKLLQFGKSQLDRLLPGNGGARAPAIDTTDLSRLIVALSTLFHDRESTLEILREDVKNYNIRERVLNIDPESPTAHEDYLLAVKKSQKSFSGIAYEIQLNIRKQTDLLDAIMEANELFIAARTSGRSSVASESCIVLIEEALGEIDQMAKNLKDGTEFYELVIPKLEFLKQQVGDASVRFTVDRCEYEENHTTTAGRRRQELDDARMAASLADNNSSRNMNDNNNDGGGGSNGEAGGDRDRGDSEHPLANQPGSDYQVRGDHMVSASHPGAVNVNHSEPQVRVDDEKVASLVAMDFDPDKVVAALRKYDNNLEQALNELLSC